MKIVKYGSSWCGPCRVTSQVLKDAGYDVTEIDVDDDDNADIVESKNIRSIPVVEFYTNNGIEPAYTHIGLLTSEELSTIINKLSC